MVETPTVGSYEDLKVWRRVMNLVLCVNRSTNSFPKQEVYGLTSQMRRSAVSVPSNIAEGKGRHSRKELLQFLSTLEDLDWNSEPKSPSPGNFDF